jgi:hypothetical protein
MSASVFTHWPAQDFSLAVQAEQVPPRQVCPAPQTCPHVPQFAASTRTLMQRPPHAVWPAGHVALQSAPKQYSPAAQLIAQAPQFAGSLWTLTQRPPHGVAPPEQAQTPPTHVPPPVQARPHPPQLAESRVVSMQLPAQSVVPAGQLLVQAPALQA